MDPRNVQIDACILQTSRTVTDKVGSCSYKHCGRLESDIHSMLGLSAARTSPRNAKRFGIGFGCRSTFGKPTRIAERHALVGTSCAKQHRVTHRIVMNRLMSIHEASEFHHSIPVCTKDVARGKRVASRIDTGMVFVNQPTWKTPDLPFGGIKNSGYGRELFRVGIQEFVKKKLVRVASIDAAA